MVRLADGTHMLGRHEHVAAGLLDWKAFSSASRPWHDPTSPRPEILLTDDPPRHTQVRKVIADALSPRALERVKDIFEARAQELLDRLRDREGETVDAVGEVSQAYVFQVLPDILGLPEEGREHMHGFSEMVWATMGPPGELFDQAMQHDYSAVIEWLETQCERGALDPDGIGETDLRRLRHAARSRSPKPSCCCRPCSAPAPTRPSSPWPTRCAPGPSSPMNTPSYAPSRRRSAPRSTNRCAGIRRAAWPAASPRATCAIDDYVIPAGTRCGLMFAAANRDPRFWDAPDDYRLDRDNKHSLGWGYGIHGCVGRTLAQMEASALLGEIVAQVESIELAGPYEPWMTTVGHGPIRQPVSSKLRLS